MFYIRRADNFVGAAIKIPYIYSVNNARRHHHSEKAKRLHDNYVGAPQMPTYGITDQNIGVTLETNGILIDVECDTIPHGPIPIHAVEEARNFTLVDDGNPNALVPKVIINLDVYISAVSAKTKLLGGIAQIAFQSLTVKAVPKGSQWIVTTR
jgi:hypothetical protein